MGGQPLSLMRKNQENISWCKPLLRVIKWQIFPETREPWTLGSLENCLFSAGWRIMTS
jgi:hypothetical protein